MVVDGHLGEGLLVGSWGPNCWEEGRAVGWRWGSGRWWRGDGPLMRRRRGVGLGWGNGGEEGGGERTEEGRWRGGERGDWGVGVGQFCGKGLLENSRVHELCQFLKRAHITSSGDRNRLQEV